MTSTPPPGSSAPAPPFLLIVSITLTGIMANVLITPAIPDIVAEFDTGAAGAGFVLAAATAPGILLAPVIGVLADRYGRKALLVPCLVVFGIAGGSAAFAPNFGALLALRLLQGVGAAGLINLAVTLIGDHYDGLDRARRMGQNAAALTASITVLPPLGGLLTAVGGWRLSFAPYWLGLATAVVVVVVLPADRQRATTTIAEQLRSTRPYLMSPQVMGSVVMAFVLFMLIFGLFLTALPYHLADRFEMGAAGRGIALAAPAVTSTLASFNLGRLHARLGTRGLMVAGSANLAVACLVIAVAGNVGLIVAAGLLYGFGDGVMIATLQDAVAGSAPTSHRGSVVAVFVGFTRAGQTFGPITAGIGLDHTSARTIFLVGAGLAASMAFGQFVIGSRTGGRQVLGPPAAN